jgi:hypothetical protein
MNQFVRIGESLVNLRWVRAVEYADGRMNVYLSDDRATGLVLRYSGEEARAAWDLLMHSGTVSVLPPPDSLGPSGSLRDGAL